MNLHMPFHKILFPILVIAILSLFISCIKDHDALLSKAISRYKAGDSTQLYEIEREIALSISIATFDTANLMSHSNIIFTTDRKSLNVLYPFKKKFFDIPINDDYIFDADDTLFSSTNGIEINFQNDKTDSDRTIAIGNEKNKIKAISIFKEKTIFLFNEKLYEWKNSAGEPEMIFKDLFNAPYAKFYNAIFNKSDKNLGLITGIAGSYYFSLIDVEQKKILIKNLSLSSSRIYFNNETIYFVGGSSGKWELFSYTITDKKKNSIRVFTDLVDIIPAEGGYFFENPKGIWCGGYDENAPVIIPFNIKPFEKCGSYVIIEVNKKYYLSDMKKMLNKINTLKNELPDLFNKPETK